MFENLARALALSATVLFSFGAAALPKISVEKINGYEVHFVDIGRGNTFGASYQIRLGTFSESGALMGRAHLLEHVMHNGSKAYPGKKAFDELLAPLGVDTNARTSNSRTFYYASGTERQAEKLVKVFLAPLGGLDWNQESFVKERQVVIDEIVSEGLPKDERAFRHMLHTHLLPLGHPWHHAPLGDLESLNNLSMDKVKELYYVNYRPENIRVTVQGNFSDPQFLARVKQWTKESLASAKISEDSQRYRPTSYPLLKQSTPSFFANPNSPTESEARLYIHSTTGMESMVVFEVDLSEFRGRMEAFDTLLGYLNINAPGTFLDKLKGELGWITEAGFQSERVGNKLHIFFGGGLSARGLEHVSEINQMMLQALREVQISGPQEKALELMKGSVSFSLERSAFSVPSFLQSYADFVEDSRPMAEQISSLFATTPREVMQAARLLHPARALYVTMGPEVADMSFDPMYQRKFKLEDNRAALKKYSAIMEDTSSEKFFPVLSAVKLAAAAGFKEKAFAQTQAEPFLKERFTVDYRDDLPDSAVSATFHMAPANPGDLVAVDLVLAAFFERFNGQMNFLRYKYQVSPASGRTTNVLTFTAGGEDAHALGAVEWALDELSAFVPTLPELEHARQSYANSANQDYVNAFSAQIALWEMVGHVDPLYQTRLQSRDLARALDLGQVQEQWQRLRASTNKEFVMVGPFSPPDFKRLQAAARNFSPAVLDDATTERMWARSLWAEQSQSLHQPLREKANDSSGVVRAYRGPPLQNVPKYVAFAALSALLEAKVKGHNRDDLGLGYIHGAVLRPLDNVNTHLILVGQADTDEKLHLTLAGWEHVLAQLRDGKFSDQEFANAIHGVLNSVTQENTSARAVLSAYSGAQSMRFDALAREKLITALGVLTPAAVRASAEEYLFASSVTSIQLTSGDCAHALVKKK